MQQNNVYYIKHPSPLLSFSTATDHCLCSAGMTTWEQQVVGGGVGHSQGEGNTVKCSTEHSSAIQCSTDFCSAIQCSAVQSIGVQYSLWMPDLWTEFTTLGAKVLYRRDRSRYRRGLAAQYIALNSTE